MAADVSDRYQRVERNWWWAQPRPDTERQLVAALLLRALLGSRDHFDIAAGLVGATSFTDPTASAGWQRIEQHHTTGEPIDPERAMTFLDNIGWPACAEPQCVALLAAVVQEWAQWD